MSRSQVVTTCRPSLSAMMSLTRLFCILWSISLIARRRYSRLTPPKFLTHFHSLPHFSVTCTPPSTASIMLSLPSITLGAHTACTVFLLPPTETISLCLGLYHGTLIPRNSHTKTRRCVERRRQLRLEVGERLEIAMIVQGPPSRCFAL